MECQSRLSVFKCWLCSLFKFLFIDLRERERNIDCCPTSVCIHWRILGRALTGPTACNLGASEGRSNQLSGPARAWLCYYYLAVSTFCLDFFINETGAIIAPTSGLGRLNDIIHKALETQVVLDKCCQLSE